MDKKNKLNKNNTISEPYLYSFLYLLFAWALSIAQPIMSLLGKQPVFLIAHEFRGWSLITFILVLNFLPPILFWFISQLIGKVSITLKEWFSRITIALLLTLFFLSYVTSLPFYFAVLMTLFGAILSVVALIRVELIRTFSVWYAVASLLFILQFFIFSDAKQLLPTQLSQNNHSVANQKNPIYIFLLDEFPLISLLDSEQKIDQNRFPSLSQFSQEATWYPNTLAISSATEMAIPSILSGLKPNRKRTVGSSEQYPTNLFTLFAPSHAIHAVENTTRMCPPSICKSVIKDKHQLFLEDILVSYLYIITPKDLQRKLPPINDRWVGYLREIKNNKKKLYNFSERKNTFTSFIDAFDNYPKNTVHFLHVLLPHAPWNILPNLKLYGFYESEGTPGQLADGDSSAQYIHQWTNDKWATQLSWRKHLLQVGAVDSLLKKAFDKIKALNQYDDATIIILADHGTAFIPKLSRRLAHDANIPDIAAIPLFIKYPKQKKGKIDNRHASNLDIVATLLDVYGIQLKQEEPQFSLVGTKQRDNYAPIIQQGWKSLKIPANYEELFEEHLFHKNQMFSQKGWDGVYHPKGTNQFLNLDIDDLIIQENIPNAIEMYNDYLFSLVNSKNQYVPAYYRLRLLSPLKNQTNEILVSLNGKIVSHCYTFQFNPSDCVGLINPNFYYKHTGLNRFRYFTVLNKKNSYIVNELLTPPKNDGAQIINNQKNRFIKYPSGQQQNINTDAPIYGSASIKRGNNNSIYQIYGWAGNTLNGEKAKKVSLFIDNKFYASTGLTMEKPYLLNSFGFESLVKSGFQINLPVEQFPNLSERNLVVIASNEQGEHAELNYTPNANDLDLFHCFDLTYNRRIPVNPQAVISFKHLNKNQENISAIDAFDESFSSISAGNWYSKNKHMMWIGAQAFIVLPSSKASKDFELVISAKPLLYKNKVDKQRLNIYLNKVLIKEFTFSKPEVQTFKFDFSVENNKHPILELEMPDAIAPSSVSTSVDSRYLSLFVSHFTITQKNKSL